MKPIVPEFSRPVPVDRIPRDGSDEAIAADAKECAALARRLGIPAIHTLKATLRAEPWRGGGVKLTGLISAEVEQVSVISLEAFRQAIEIPVERYFLPPSQAALDEESDADPIEAGHIDLGEVVAESLALDLDPYPRRPDEKFELSTAEDEAAKASPFTVLSALKPGT